MNATEITQVIAAIGTFIGVLVTAIISLRNGWKTDKVAAKTEVVAAHVNSAATKSNEEIKSLRDQITALKADMADKKEIAALLASKIPIPLQVSEPQKVEVVNEPHDPVPTQTIKKV